MLRWAYGVTTVAERFETTLDATLHSLNFAGFTEPLLFVDGSTFLPGYLQQKFEAVYRSNRLGAYPNWILAATELFYRQPDADLFALFQDDFITYQNLRRYLEWSPPPARSYFNLYTFPANEPAKPGWHLAKGRGLGAVALVFSNAAMRCLLSSQHMLDRMDNRKRRHNNIDGAVNSALKKCGYHELVHSPSLTQHLDGPSTMGNGKHEQAISFKGADFDALQFTNDDALISDSHKCRVGVVFHANARVKIQDDEWKLAEMAQADWVLLRGACGSDADKLAESSMDAMFCPHARPHQINQFLQYVDVVLFSNFPPYNTLVKQAHPRKRVVCAVTDSIHDVHSRIKQQKGNAESWLSHVDDFCFVGPSPAQSEVSQVVSTVKGRGIMARFDFVSEHESDFAHYVRSGEFRFRLPV